MPTYHPNARSLVYGLSDFWTLYFKDLATIEALYEGVEIDLGQAYLDLLTLLLNNSVQDAALFNKEYFKLLRVREDAVTFSSDGTHAFALGSDVALVKYLNNKVFAVTSSFERGVDFDFDSEARSAIFEYDPFHAYKSRTFGVDNGAFIVAGKVPGSVNDEITLDFVDNGTSPPVLSRTGFAFTIQYDGPANTRLTTAASIVNLLNTSLDSSGLLKASLAGLGTGTDTFTSPGAPVGLVRSLNTAIEGFATRTYDVKFGTRFSDPRVTNWLLTDVQKGDVLRVLGGPGFGAPQEFPIALLRPASLLLYPEAAPADLPSKLDYVILRSPLDDLSTEEPFVPSTPGVSYGALGNVLTAGTQQLYVAAPLVPFSPVHVGSCIELGGLYSAGEYHIASVIDGNTVVLAGPPLASETNVPVIFHTPVSSYASDGVLADNGNGTATFTSVSGAFAVSCIGGVLLLQEGGALNPYAILDVPSATTLVLAYAGATAAAGLTYGVADQRPSANTLVFSFPAALPVPGELNVLARRLLDGRQVVEGTDYTVNYDLGVVTPKTVWRSSITNRVTYRFRNVITGSSTSALQTGAAGTLSGVSTFFFSDPGLVAANLREGDAITVGGSSGAVNDGVFYVVGMSTATTAILTSDRTPVLPEANNGALTWTVHARGGLTVTDTVEPVQELGIWATDARIDKYHLYYTYGYLVNRAEVSSESYRALIRGLFQLFMLGPTLERFESAINTCAGLDTVRDDGEILLGYSNEAVRAGSNGAFDAAARTFTSATGGFTIADLDSRIYCSSGYNANKLFSITGIVDNTTVLLEETPTTDSGAAWEITSTSTHSVITSRTTYRYPRTAPIKPKYLDSANYGVLTLRAFEVITSAFEVTDYVESPWWWERTTIPEQLWQGASLNRRTSTPALFENVIGAPDAPCIGDPGFYIGASDTGVIPPRVTLQSGVANGVLYGDPGYPMSDTETYFECAAATFTDDDIGNILELDYPLAASQYMIVGRISAVRVKIRSYLPLPHAGTAPLNWRLVNGTVPMRHTAAYVILDKVLKHHLFSVRFDGYLLERLPSNTIAELQRLVFVAKPTYTYLVLTPSTLFDDVVRVTEDTLAVAATYHLGGAGGEMVQADEHMLAIDGTWMIGGWYRYVSNVSTFATPAASVPDYLGVTPAGYRQYVQRTYIDPGAFLDASTGQRLEMDVQVPVQLDGAANGMIESVSGDKAVFNSNVPGTFEPWMPLYYVRIAAPAVNQGHWRIGNVLDDQRVELYAPGASLEVGLTWQLESQGWTFDGRTELDASGQSFFTDTTGTTDFTALTGTHYIRRPFITSALQRSWEIAAAVSTYQARLATRHSLGTFVCDVTAADTLDCPGMIFDGGMCRYDRYQADPSTHLQRIYYATMVSGPDAGTTVRLERYLSPTGVRVVDAALLPFTGATAEIWYYLHYTLTPEGGPWELLRRQNYVDNLAGPYNQLTVNSTAAAGVASYEAYGVRVPENLGVAVYDATAGDTYYAIGGQNPVYRYARPRTGRDMDLEDSPLTIRAY